jgi:phage-related holin
MQVSAMPIMPSNVHPGQVLTSLRSLLKGKRHDPYKARVGAHAMGQWMTALISSAVAFWSATPSLIRDLTTVAVWLIIIDTCGGMFRAALEGRLRSRQVTRGVIVKVGQFCLMFAAFAGFAWLAHNPMILGAPLLIIILHESTSIIETVYALEKLGGIRLPPQLRETISRLGSKYLAIASLFEDKPGATKEPLPGNDESHQALGKG